MLSHISFCGKGYSVLLALSVCIFALESCSSNGDNYSPVIFKVLTGDQTNVVFSNNVQETDSLNILDYLYFYNGAGVASADFNNDGLEDLYFVSNQQSNRLYLNKGDLKFEDITAKSGTAGSGNWKTGVTVVDINDDGFKDIYVSVVSGYKSLSGKNQLYINNGDLTFTDKAADYGLDFAGLSTQASFFDYDKDGDLDMYLLTHSVHSNDTYGDSTLRFKFNDAAGDHLFRNDSKGFSDVTKGSGIYGSPIGYGLGISISDFNNDGWDDIYVSNDFFEQDYYYINQQDGTFKEKLKDAFGHTSLFSMGNAAGDINQDGNLDLITTDMLPGDVKVLKSTINDEPLDIYNLEVKSGFYYQYSRNSLQLNVGQGKKFVDIGLYSGVSATDWTWTPIIQDFDMDGNKDLFFSNGIKRRLNDLDYLKYLGDPNVMADFDKDRKFDRNKINKMPDGRVRNYLFAGDSVLKFTDISGSNDMQDPSAASGAIYVDLDNDGDLEIVTNNMDEPASIYQNTTITPGSQASNKYLSYSLKFKKGNIDAIGTKLFMRSQQGKVDHQEVQTSSGFQSGQSYNILFTFASNDKAAELLIVWPDNSYELYKQFDMGKKELIAWGGKTTVSGGDGIGGIIQDFIKDSSQFEYTQMDADLIGELKTNSTPDFNYYSLLPHTYLKHTPAIAVADVNNDGFDDLYVGGLAGEEKYLLVGDSIGKFKKTKVEAFNSFSNFSDAEALWADLDNDGDSDLVVTNAEHPLLDFQKIGRGRVFINQGNFKFEYKPLPHLGSLTSKIAIVDYNGDGLKDILMAAGVYFKNYSRKLPSFLILNKGNGNFSVAPPQLFPELTDLSFVKELTVSDLNNDGKDDLVISAEWQPLQIFVSDGKRLQKRNIEVLNKLNGWWQSAAVADIDEDGKTDLIAGNWGLNSKYNVAEDHPVYAYSSDVDRDSKPDLIISYFHKGKYYPFRPKNDLEQELPYLKKEWLSYQKMADKTTSEIFGNRINEDERLEANTFESIFISDVLGNATITTLPWLYQQSPITSFASAGQKNRLIASGNHWGAIPYEGKYDALGLVTLEYDKSLGRFVKPNYWVNSQLNFDEISYIKKIRTSQQNNWIVLTAGGKLLHVSESSRVPLLAKK